MAGPDALTIDNPVLAHQAEILARPALWPNTIIVMTLARIGGDAGPDLNRLAAIVAKAAGRHIYAAGGVRNASRVHIR